MAGKRTKHYDLPPRVTQKGKAYYYYYRDVEKKKRFIALGSDRAEMLRKYAEIDPQYRGGEIKSRKGTFEELANEYIIHEMPNKSKASQDSQKFFLKKLRTVFGDMLLTNINSTHIASYLDKSPKKVAANREINLMSAIFNKGIRWGYCTANPCLGVARNKEQSRSRYITDDELRFLRNNAPPQLKCIIDLAYITGLRRGDILKIQKLKPTKVGAKDSPAYIDNDFLFVQQGKTGKRLKYQLAGMLKIVIERSLELSHPSSPYLFNTREGKHYTKSSFDSVWRRFINKLDVHDLHFHDLRAKAATDAKKNGLDAQKLLGHADAKMTEVYIRNREIDEVEALHSAIMVED